MSELMTRFYEAKKDLFDISGNIINQDKYPFMTILAGYLTDIVGSIDQEIKNTSRASSINWKEKKNPKLLSKFINNDENINIINRCVNKITSKNYQDIAVELTQSIENDCTHNSNDYSKYIFESIIKKCINEESFCNDYLAFLNIISGNIGENCKTLLSTFVKEVFNIMNNNEYIKNVTYFNFIKDVVHFHNIGLILGSIYTQYKNNKSKVTMYENEIITCLLNNVDIINGIIDWQPVNMDELISRSFLMTGILESIYKQLNNYFKDPQVIQIKECLNLLYNFNGGLLNKLKFKILDIQDIIEKNSIKSEIVKPKPNIIKEIIKETVKETVKEPVKQIIKEPAFTIKHKKNERKQSKTQNLHIEDNFEYEISTPKIMSTNNMFDLLDDDAPKVYKPKKSSEFAKDGSEIYGKKNGNSRKH
jgi:hypothetical protein